MIFELLTGPSTWMPITMAFSGLILLLVVLLIKASGKKGFKYSEGKAMPFYSGNIPSENTRFKASGFFWGFTEALKNYYSLMKRIHTGIVNDYVFWFVASAAIILICFLAGGLL